MDLVNWLFFNIYIFKILLFIFNFMCIYPRDLTVGYIRFGSSNPTAKKKSCVFFGHDSCVP